MGELPTGECRAGMAILRLWPFLMITIGCPSLRPILRNCPYLDTIAL